MKIFSGCQPERRIFFVGYSTILLWASRNAIVDAYTAPLHLSLLQTPLVASTTPLGDSLDDVWNEALIAMDASSNTIVPSTVIKSSQALQWEQMFSDESFKAFSSATHDMMVLMAQMPVWVEAAMFMTPTLVIAHLYLFRFSHPPLNYRQGMEPYPRGKYDPIKAREYYQRHPILVARRLAELFRLSYHWLFHLLVEKYIYKNEEHREERAQELLALITHLGPTAVKIGQVLSVRSDILSEEYSQALSTLQDKVPPFDLRRARQILLRELGPDKIAKLRGLEKGPVASASIGQVYKCMLDGQEIAVKVQRPDVLSEIGQRTCSSVPKNYSFSRGFSGTGQRMGSGFHCRARLLPGSREHHRIQQGNAKTTERILTTEWVHGTRIDQSPDVEDIPRLCSVALNAYLVMLLETSKLHSDPHPGNLLRTPDGRLCILDFGMVLNIDKSLQYSLLEYVAHLTSEDYDQLPEDMAKLGFLQADKVDFVRRSGVLEPLKYFLKQAGEGGGAKIKDRIIADLRVKYPGKPDGQLRTIMRQEMEQHFQEIVHRESVATGITVEIEELQRQNEDAFRIPEWFVYTSRAFLTLEGVSLAADEDYSLIKSCFPYIAKRLVADSDPRAAKALRDILYGAGSNIDVNRLADLADGFSSYTSTTKSVNERASNLEALVPATGGTRRLSDIERKAKHTKAEAAITLAKDSADILLNPEGNLVQSLIVGESVLAASARAKDTLRSIVTGPEKFRESLPMGMGALLPPLPFENHVRKHVEPFVELTAEERKALELASSIGEVIAFKSHASRREREALVTKFIRDLRNMDPEQAALVVRELRENLPKYAPQAGMLGQKFFATLLRTVSDSIEATLEKASPGGMIGATAKGLATVAQQGVKAMSSLNKSHSSDDPRLPPTAMQSNLSGNSTLL
eukprot:scaffold561_cov162-Amphora_coffeaeformis.AAC.8